MAGDRGFMVDGQPVDLTLEEVGQIRRLQLIMLVAAIGGSLTFFAIIMWLGPFEGMTPLAIAMATAAPAFVSYLLFRRTAIRVLNQSALRRDHG